MKTINCKINDSAYKKLKNLQQRKGYSELGDLIAYLVKQENKRIARDSESKKTDGVALSFRSPARAITSTTKDRVKVQSNEKDQS